MYIFRYYNKELKSKIYIVFYNINLDKEWVSRTIMNKKRWTIFSIVALIVALAIFAGGFILVVNTKKNSLHTTPAQITTLIINQMDYTDMAEVSYNQLSKHYSIPDGIIADSSLYMSKSSDSASELACFLLTDKSRFTQLNTAITNHINAKAVGFKSLNPTQYNALKSCTITQNGKYVLVSVGSNASADANLFEELLK